MGIGERKEPGSLTNAQGLSGENLSTIFEIREDFQKPQA
jgi:hypothetical protein